MFRNYRIFTCIYRRDLEERGGEIGEEIGSSEIPPPEDCPTEPKERVLIKIGDW